MATTYACAASTIPATWTEGVAAGAYSASAESPHPCKSLKACRSRVSGAVAEGRSSHPRALEPVPQHGRPSVVPVNPNSRKGRIASPLEQGRVTMEHTTVVGIDVSKERLDVHVLPSEEAWAVSRDADGLAELCRRLAGLSGVVAVEATGGYETIVAASLSSAGLPLVVVNPAQVRAFAKALGQRAKT